jgi:hypothetical protein
MPRLGLRFGAGNQRLPCAHGERDDWTVLRRGNVASRKMRTETERRKY